MRYLFPNQLLFLHKRVTETSGGDPGVRDPGRMEAAVYRPQATFGGADLYPDVFSKAAALGRSIIKNHPFVDGNKRTGFEAMRLFMRLNGFDVRAGEDEKFDFVMKISATSDCDVQAIAAWLKRHSRKHS